MSDTYELYSGEVIDDKPSVRLLKILDRLDPISNRAPLNDELNIKEFVAWQPEIWWCPNIRSVIKPLNEDTFSEHIGDDVLYSIFMEFNNIRRIWAQNRLDLSKSEGETALTEKYLKFVIAANKSANIKAMVNLFCKTRTISSEHLNSDSTTFGTLFGAFELEFGQLLNDYYENENVAKEFMITKQIRALPYSLNFDRELEYDERWDEFILEIMCGDQEKADYLQRALGYSIIGGNPEECMFIAYGATTRNGKGTLLNTISYVLGDYAANMPSDFLTRSKQRSSSDDDALGALEGKRFVTMSEPTANKILDEAKVKSLTGNDPITVARKYCPTTTFYPQFTMWLSCNRLPRVEDTSVFTSGRVRVIPFERHFEKEEQDSTLKEKFRSKNGMYTVWAWLCDGYLEWKKQGLNEPESIRLSTKSWSNAGGDDFQKFIDEECIISVNAKIKTAEFYEIYKAWATAREAEVFTNNKIKSRLKDLAITSERSTGGNYFFKGIDLKKLDINNYEELINTSSKPSSKGSSKTSLRSSLEGKNKSKTTKIKSDKTKE